MYSRYRYCQIALASSSFSGQMLSLNTQTTINGLNGSDKLTQPDYRNLPASLKQPPFPIL